MRQLWTNIWLRLNGNKTAICSFIASMLGGGMEMGLLPEKTWIKWIMLLFITLGGASFGHHIKKGYFSKDKGH